MTSRVSTLLDSVPSGIGNPFKSKRELRRCSWIFAQLILVHLSKQFAYLLDLHSLTCDDCRFVLLVLEALGHDIHELGVASDARLQPAQGSTAPCGRLVFARLTANRVELQTLRERIFRLSGSFRVR